MDLMRFNGYAFPYNPRKIEVGHAKNIKVVDMPFSAPVLQDLGLRPRVIKGEGELFGGDCFLQFEQLQAEFVRGGAGQLVCPLCEPMYAYFSALGVVGEPGPLALHYAFEFVEQPQRDAALKNEVVTRGQSLWELSARYSVPVDVLLALNPHVTSAEFILNGQVVALP